jgi:chromate reductase
MKRIAAISGSLKTTSVNMSILKSLRSMGKEKYELRIFEGLDLIPYFRQEHDHEHVDDSVTAFRKFLRNADAVIISTPEYAFGVPGVLKNALEWLVSSAELYEKPVATISASPTPMGGDKAHESLRLTLTALGARFIESGMVTIPSVKLKVNAEGEIINKDLASELENLVNALLTAN